MKLLTVFLFAGFLMFDLPADQLNIGDKAPKQALKLKNVDGSTVSLESLKAQNGLCVIYSCNTCPWVIAWEDRYNEIYKECKEAGIGFVLVNSNEAKREGADSLEEMKKHAQGKGLR